MEPPRRYAFNPPWGTLIIGIVFFGALSGYLFHLAGGFHGLISFLWIAVSAIFAVLALIGVIRRLVFPRVLELSGDAVLLPHGVLRTRIAHIAYDDIMRMWENRRGNQTGLWLVTSRRHFAITASHLPDAACYEEVRYFIVNHVSGAEIPDEMRESSGGFYWQDLTKPMLRWVEPEAWACYRRSLNVSKPLFSRLAGGLWYFFRCFAIVMLPWLLLRAFQLPTLSVAGYVGLSVSFSLWFTWLRWLSFNHPVHVAEISYREMGLSRFQGKQTADWKYQGFSGWCVIERPFAGSVISILLLKQKVSGSVRAFALPDNDTRVQTVKLLSGKVPESPDLMPSWEVDG